jgi:hypothetical protein
VLANDSDPDGDALSLDSAGGAGFSASGNAVAFTSTASTGRKTGNYIVRDPHGGGASATLTVTVSGGVCPLHAPSPGPRPGPAPAPAPGEDGPG